MGQYVADQVAKPIGLLDSQLFSHYFKFFSLFYEALFVFVQASVLLYSEESFQIYALFRSLIEALVRPRVYLRYNAVVFQKAQFSRQFPKALLFYVPE